MANRLSFKTFSVDIRMILIIFLLPFPFLSDARQEKHFLFYKFTAFCKASAFPVFKAVGVCDDREIVHYSTGERVWIRSSLTADNWIGRPAEPPDSRDWFLHQLNTLSNCTDSQCSELHVLQRVIGCELEKFPDGTVSLRAFDEFGFDGEDCMAFDSETLQWIDKNPKAKETKMKWDQQTERIQFLKQYLKTCTDWISTFNNTKKTSPVVRVFVKKAPDQSKLVLSCLATGFYPRDIEMYIRLNESVLVNQTSSGIRPNDDGSFQMRTSVETEANHEGFYDCLVIHSSLTQTQPIVTVWTIYQQKSSESLWSFIAGMIAAAVVIFLSVIGCCIYQKKRSYEKHYLHYMFTVMIKADTLLVFSAVGESDHIQISHYSIEERVWMRENLTVDDWNEAPGGPPETRDWYQDLIRILSNCTESSELYVLQRMIGCELEKLPDGTVNLTPVDEYGFGGEDCVAFHSDTLQCSDKRPNAKTKRDHQVKLQAFLKNCLDWISTFNNTKKNSPDVRVSARRAPDDHSKLVLSCLATGFYPRDIEMNIRLNRINMQNQISSGIRPNDDETFQMRTSVKIDRNHRGSYDCLVIHSSLTEPASVEWDGRCSGCETESQWSVTVGIVISALVLVVVFSVIHRCINKRKKHHGLMRSYRYYGEATEQLQIPKASDQELNTH